VADSASLRKLDLSWNCFGDDGIEMIIKWLQHNTSLTEIDLGNCEITEKGIYKLIYNKPKVYY